MARGDFDFQRGHVSSDLAADTAEDSAEPMDRTGVEEGINVLSFARVWAGCLRGGGDDGWQQRSGVFKDRFGIDWLR